MLDRYGILVFRVANMRSCLKAKSASLVQPFLKKGLIWKSVLEGVPSITSVHFGVKVPFGVTVPFVDKVPKISQKQVIIFFCHLPFLTGIFSFRLLGLGVNRSGFFESNVPAKELGRGVILYVVRKQRGR